MQPIRPKTINIPGTPALVVSPRVMLSNLVTLLVSVNHKPTMLRPLSQDIMGQWFATAGQKILKNDDTLKMVNMFTPESAADFKDPARLFLQEYSRVIGALMSDADYQPDAAEEMTEQLVKTGDWDVINVTSPSLGFPRKYLSFKYEIGDGVPLMGTALKEVHDFEWVSGAPASSLRDTKGETSQARRVQMALARLCWLFDRIYMGVNLIPETKHVGERDPKEPFIGRTTAAMLQARRLTAVPLLYLTQYAAMWPRMVNRIDEYASELARSLYPRDAAALDLREKVRDAALAKLPLHPLLQTFVSMFESPLKVSTYYGEKECLLVPNTVELPSSTSAYGTRSGLAQVAVSAALSEQLRLATLDSSTQTSGWVKQIIGDVAPNISMQTARDQAGISRGTGFATLLEVLVRISSHIELFPTIEQQLGWTGARSIVLTQVEAAGADFVLTNGDYYSDSPTMVLAGLRPGLPISNNKVLGFARRFDAQFNSGPSYGLGKPYPAASDDPLGRCSVIWSTLTCNGFHATSDSDELYSKYYMPAGMSMGEEGGESRWNNAESHDPIGQRVAAYFARMSSGGYVRRDAMISETVQSRSAQNLFRSVTDWDTAVESATDPSAAQTDLLTAYGNACVDREISLLRYRDHWKDRVPVRMARDNHVVWLNEVGNPVKTIQFDGNVAFDDVVNLGHDVSAIDALLSLLPVDGPKFAAELNEEVQAPE